MSVGRVAVAARVPVHFARVPVHFARVSVRFARVSVWFRRVTRLLLGRARRNGRRTRSEGVSMREMGRDGRGSNRDRVRIGRIARRYVTDGHLSGAVPISEARALGVSCRHERRGVRGPSENTRDRHDTEDSEPKPSDPSSHEHHADPTRDPGRRAPNPRQIYKRFACAVSFCPFRASRPPPAEGYLTQGEGYCRLRCRVRRHLNLGELR